MSRRAPNPAAERAAQNQQTIKSLLKLEPNKICADCKRNKHPRWASWNLGIFICIRCSGIHRGMGTHISRVKSVDLDTWTDEQLQSILSWGNARANKYWEAKLAPGHAPSEAKIENFIRTKYELKRWVMDGPKPDPATLDVEGDDDMPLSLVKEKQTLGRRESLRQASAGAPPAAAAPAAAPPAIDLFGGDFVSSSSSTPPPRASTAGPTATRVPAKAPAVPPKATPAASTKDSLLGLDFLGGPSSSAPARPASTTTVGGSGSTAQSRPDLKQSILSLYATAPRVQPQQPQQPQMTGGSFSGGGGGFVDAFSSLSFSSQPAAAPTTTSPKPVDAFSGLSGLVSPSSAPSRSPVPASTSAFGSLGGGSFFDAKPAATVSHTQSPPLPKQPVLGGFGGLNAFSSSPSPPVAAAATSSSSNAFGDLFDFSSPSAAQAPAAAAAPTTIPTAATGFSPPSTGMNSVFNLSAPAPQPAAAAVAPQRPAATSPLATAGANLSNADVWGSNAWGSNNNNNNSSSSSSRGVGGAGFSSSMAAPVMTTSSTSTGANDFGWGSSGVVGSGSGGGSFATQSIVPGASGGFAPAPKVAADEEFGGWSSSTAPAPAGNGSAKTGGFGANEDLFSNVWG